MGAVPYDANMLQHYTDTRTGEGRVRFLLDGADVLLITEGQGWEHHSRFEGFQEAVLALALDHHVPQQLYVDALDELHQRMDFFSQLGAA